MFLQDSPGQKKRPSFSKKKLKTKSSLAITGWNTSDADEIERRRIRARTEPLRSQAIESGCGYFGTYVVFSKQHGEYSVEIRSLTELINSCDCQDYCANGLGTCKHIEHVLFHLQKTRKRAFKLATLEGSPRIEIYIDRRDNNITKIRWSKNIPLNSLIRRCLSVFFNADDTLKADLLDTYPKIQSAILAISSSQPKKVRISRHMEDVLEYIRFQREKEKNKKRLLIELAEGKHKTTFLKHPLYLYQEVGMLHLALQERALLSDEMGLGKTVQAIAACELLKRSKGIKKVLVITTASLKTEWEEQIAKFTREKSLIIRGTRPQRLSQYEQPAFFYLCNYEQIKIDSSDINWILSPDVIILDEAQRIKNWKTKTANAAKTLKSRYAFVLTGSPLENRINDIYSIIQFLDPNIFGPLFRFNRDFYQFGKDGRPIGYKNLDLLYQKLQPIMLRRRKEDIEDQLPNRTIKNYFVGMETEQRLRYNEYQDKVIHLFSKSKRQPLQKEEYEKMQKWLSCMRMICDTPYILDPKCRISPKIDELKPILEELLSDPTTKIIIFSEWERMLELVCDLTEKMGVEFVWHTGKLQQQKTGLDVNSFKEDPYCRLLLSTDADSLELNFQAANIVINLDLPWDLAKLEQRIARLSPKHQTHTLSVINFVTEDSIEHRMLSLLSQKQTLAEDVLENLGDLKEIKLPSGQAAYMELVESLMREVQTAPERVPDLTQTTENFPLAENALIPIAALPEISGSTTNHTMSSPDLTIPNEDKGLERFSKKINLIVQEALELAESIPKITLAIVDDLNEQKTLSSSLKGTTAHVFVEIIDRNTFEIIQRLAKSGVLSLNEQIQILTTLSQNPSVTPERNK